MMLNMKDPWQQEQLVGAGGTVVQTERDLEQLALDPAEELDWLMSLALDSQLDEEDAARLESLLAAEVDHAAEWQTWQAVDNSFRHAPRAVPSSDFATKVETRLAQWERRRKLRVGVLFGLAALVLWTGAFAGVAALGVFFWSSQVVWLGNVVHSLALWWASVRQVAASLFSGVDVLLDAPQTWFVLMAYLCLAMGVLSSWFVWLRRSIQPVATRNSA